MGWFHGLRTWAVPLHAAEGLEWATRQVAAMIMREPDCGSARSARLARAGRLIGEAAQNLRDAASILEGLDHGPE